MTTPNDDLEGSAARRAWLTLPAGEGVRRLALSQLGLAEELLGAFDRENPEALHDLRVSLRRLRSTLRSYRDVLADGPTPKTLKRLSKVVGRTGRGRDTEVQVAWIDAQLAALDEAERAQAIAFRDALLVEKDDAYRALESETLPAIARTLVKLRRELATYSIHRTLDLDEEVPKTFAEILRDAVLGELESLTDELRSIRGLDDDESIHDARIAGKRLRYLLEPFREASENGKNAARALKRLQDVLGDLHDAAVRADLLAHAIEGAAVAQARRAVADVVKSAKKALEGRADVGLLSLLRVTHEGRVVLYESLRAEYVEGESLLSLAAAIHVALDELAPKESVEIERKYLLSGLPPEAKAQKPLLLEQGYVPGKAIIERVRRTVSGRKTTYARTMKLGAGVKRIEVEEPLTKSLYDRIFALTEGRRVRKHRHEVTEADGLVWQIDVFLDRDLVLAEVELDAESDTPSLPAWLEPFVVREVTDEPEFVNARLAR